MKSGELAVRVFEAGERYRTSGSCGGTAHLRDTVLEAIGQIDARPMFSPGNRIADRLSYSFYKIGHPETPAPRFHIDLVFDWPKYRLQFGRRHGGIDPPHSRHLVRLLAGHDFQQCVPLALVSTLVDYDLHC